MEWIIGVGSSLAASALFIVIARAAGLITISAKRRAKRHQLATRMHEAGFVDLFLTRADYATYRKIPTVMGYLATARNSVIVIGYWMAQGNEIEDINEIERMILTRTEFTVGICIIDPEGPHIQSLAAHLGDDPEQIRRRCMSTLTRLQELWSRLPPTARQRLTIKTYRSTPVASVIILDGDRPYGRIQLDFKPYRTPRHRTFGFELSGPGKPLYDTCFQAWGRMFNEASLWDGITTKEADQP